MQKLILYIIFSLAFALTINAQEKSINDEAKITSYLQHSNTFLWYARHRSNTYSEFNTAKKYLDSANILLLKHKNDSSKNYSAMLGKAKFLDATLSNALDVSIDNLNGRYPLYMDITKRNSDLEFIDEAEEIALEKCLEQLITISYNSPSKPINEIMHFAVITGLQSNPALEEVALQFLTNKTNSYIISDYDLSGILTVNQIEDLKDNRINEEIYLLISNHFNCDRIGNYSITKNDEVDHLFYYSSVYTTFNVEKNKIDFSALTESFSMDRTNTSSKFYWLLLMILTINFAILLLFKFTLKQASKRTWFKKNPILISGSASFWSHFIIDSICVLSSFVIALGSSYLLSHIAPFEGSYYKEPFAVIWRISSFTLAPLIPLFINFYVFSKLLKRVKVYRDINSLLAIITGSLTGMLIYAFYLYLLRFNELPDLDFIASFIIPSHLTSIPLSIALISLFRVSSKLPEFKKSVIRLFLSLVSISFIYYSIWLETDLSSHWDNAIISSLIILGALLIPEIVFSKTKKNDFIKFLNKRFTNFFNNRFIKFLSKLFNRFSDNTDDVKEMKIQNDNDLTSLFSNPLEKGISINFSPDLSKKLINIITPESSENKIRTIYLKDKREVGKTTFIKEFVLKELEGIDGKDVKVFYGDCDEYQDGNTIPYEPFIEAFEIILGAERTSGASEKKLQGIATLLASMDSSGIIKSFVNRGESAESEKAVKFEMEDLLSALHKFIDGLTSGNKYTVIVFEDIQWIDNRSFKLLEALINKLNELGAESKSNLTFIFTSSEIDQNTIKTTLIEQNDDVKAFIDNPETIIKGLDYSYDEGFANRLSEDFKKVNYLDEIAKAANLKINPLDLGIINGFMRVNGLNTPPLIQNFLVGCVKKQFIQLVGNNIIVNDNTDFNSITYSNEIKAHYFNLFESLDENLLNILETAAYIGNDFEATIIGKIWKMERLNVLILLRKAEKIGLIIDKSDNDDIYEFKSKVIVSQLRDYAITSSLKSKKTAIPQLIKEYHKQIIEAFEDLSIEKQKSLLEDYGIICAMAERAYAYREGLQEKALKYSSLAFSLSLKKGNLMNAKNYFTYFTNIISDSKIKWTDELLIVLEEGIKLENESSKSDNVLKLTEKVLLDLLESKYPMDDTIGNIYCQYLSSCIASINKHSPNEFITNMFSNQSEVFSDLTFNSILFQEKIIKFNNLKEGQTKEKENIVKSLSDVLTENKIDFYDLKKKILNFFCMKILNDKDLSYLLAGDYIHQNLEMIAEYNNLSFESDIEILNRITEKETFDELSNSDKISLKFITGYFLDFLIRSNDIEKAEEIVPINIFINESLYDDFGIGHAYSRQAKTLVKRKKNKLVNEAYKNSLVYFLRNLRSNASRATFNISLNLIAWNDFLKENNLDFDDFNTILSNVKSNKKFDLDLIDTKNNDFATKLKTDMEGLQEKYK